MRLIKDGFPARYLDHNDAGDLQLYQFSLFPLLPAISYERTF